MSLPKLENVKQELDGLSAKLEELRSDASVIISMIDANKLLSTELTQGFSKNLRNMRNHISDSAETERNCSSKSVMILTQ